MATPKRTAIYVGENLASYLEAREGPRSASINTLADRYMHILAGSRLDLSDAELSLIRDANNGTVFTPARTGLPGLAYNVEDAIKLDNLDRKWGVDGAALVAKLRACTRAELACLVEDVERYWSSAGVVSHASSKLK